MVPALLALTSGSAVHAQDVRSHTQGFLLGLDLNGASLDVEDGDKESGGGGGLTIGVGVSRMVQLFLRGDLSAIDISNPDIQGSYGLILIDLGVRVSFGGPEHRFVPYVLGALTGMTASADVEVGPVLSTNVKVTGGGATLGGGFQHYFKPGLALDVGLLLTTGSFTDVEVGSLSREIDELDASAARLDVGLTWYLSRR
jgi:hypothetical protein